MKQMPLQAGGWGGKKFGGSMEVSGEDIVIAEYRLVFQKGRHFITNP